MEKWILFFVACVALGAILGFFASPIGKGIIGEGIVRLKIGRTKKNVRYTINNYMLALQEGKSSQIDHIVINRYGVFVIETKNYAGRIYGRDNQESWTQVLKYGKIKNHFYSPVKQNATHIYRLKSLLPQDTPVTSVIVFVRGNTKYIQSSCTYPLADVKRVLKTNPSNRELTAQKMEQIYRALLLQAEKNAITTKEHVKNIRNMRKEIDENICPRCGGALVQKKGAYGAFMGCSNYPRCRFIKKNL